MPDQESRLLTWTWPRWIPLDEQARAAGRFAWIEAGLRRWDKPVQIIWGREDEVFEPTVFAGRFKALIPHAEGPHLVTGRHFLQEDSGAEIGNLVAGFVHRVSREGAR